jgi:hypothetical protein
LRARDTVFSSLTRGREKASARYVKYSQSPPKTGFLRYFTSCFLIKYLDVIISCLNSMSPERARKQEDFLELMPQKERKTVS